MWLLNLLRELLVAYKQAFCEAGIDENAILRVVAAQ
jgi:hypothetical protein